ncbi:acyl-CoA thioesterase [Thalassococcus sp. BH17M4-6]|uniref:acyl-CoA thioesterase n=1 Tax=Thalassococcus sp. BH17M4-6 TaxID=3413148 RepID=UPI003BE3A513
MAAYKYINEVGLAHCDAAGIVFLPRYYEMIHAVIENWFEEALDWPMGQMLGSDRLAVPLVDVATSFPSASRLGDRLTWRLVVTGIGKSSMSLRITAQCDGDLRVDCTATLVLSEVGVMRTRRWPDAIRAGAEEFLSAASGHSAPEPASAAQGKTG